MPGYDVVMFLKVLRLGSWTLGYFAPYALLVILPCNAFGEGAQSGYFVTTIANLLRTERRRIWTHLLGVFLFQLIFMAVAPISITNAQGHRQFSSLETFFMCVCALWHDSRLVLNFFPLLSLSAPSPPPPPPPPRSTLFFS